MLPKPSGKARIKAIAQYLRFRGICGKNRIITKHNELLENFFGNGNYNAKVFVESRKRLGKRLTKR